MRQPLGAPAWEPPYAMSAALKRQKNKIKKIKKKRHKAKNQILKFSIGLQTIKGGFLDNLVQTDLASEWQKGKVSSCLSPRLLTGATLSSRAHVISTGC